MNSHGMFSRLRGRKPTVTHFVLLVALAAFCGAGLVSGTAQSAPGEKELERDIPSHLPIKVKVRNWEKVKNPENENWLDDFEVEVTNTGTKPIYFLHLSLSLHDVLLDGVRVGYQLRYGRLQLVDFQEPVQPDDIPIRPSESIVVKARTTSIKGWKAFKAKGKVSHPKKLKLTFQLINHGGGTGFMGPLGSPKPNRGRAAKASVCGAEKAKTEPPSDSRSVGNKPNPYPGLASFIQPVSFLPA